MSKSTDIPPLSKWPLFDLVTYGRELGLDLNENMARQNLVEVIRGRQELILDLDESALREVLSWAGVAVGATESKEQITRKVVGVRKMRYKGLSTAGLYALARLRSIEVDREHERNEITRRLKRAESIWQKLARKRRRLAGTLIAKAFVGKAPEEEASREKRDEMVRQIKDSLEDEGVVGGLAGQLKTAADDYVAQKLDEIDRRIDHKLDDIDRRLAEWRDREVATRLRIIKITLLASVLVALLSLGYTVLKQRVLSGDTKIMYETLSKRSDKVVKLANAIAREHHQEYVGTEHVLLAILREGTGIGSRIFKERGYGEETVKQTVDQLIKKSLEETWVFGRLPGSPHFRNVVARAIEEARGLKSKEVCTEHILLGLLREPGSVAYNVLEDLKMGYDDVRADVLTLQQAASES